MDKKTVYIFLLIIFGTLINIPGAFALPQYLDAYNTTFNTNGSCSICHVNPEGGGPRNAYGQKFENQTNHASDPSSALRAIELPPSAPNIPNQPIGPSSGYVGTSYTYSTTTIDPNNDKIKYTFDWGDGSQNITDFVNSGSSTSASHSWTNPGTYNVKAIAIDIGSLSSEWSTSLSVTIESPPKLSVFPDLSFNFGTMNAEESTSQIFSISNSGGGTLNWNITYDQSWITINPTHGTNSGTVTISINTADLSPDSYSGNITVNSNGGNKHGVVLLNIRTTPPSSQPTTPSPTPTLTPSPTSTPTLTPTSTPTATPTPTITVTPIPTSSLTPTLIPSQTPPPNNTSNISISSSPPGARIYLDGSYQGTAPMILTGIAAGSHTLTLSLEGYLDWSQTFNVVAGQTSSVSAYLIPYLIIFIAISLAIGTLILIIYRKRKTLLKGSTTKVEKRKKELKEKIEKQAEIIPGLKTSLDVKNPPKNAYGVIIGISRYKDPSIPTLKYAKDDALEIYNILTDPEHGNFPKENVKLLLDEQATLTEIKSAMGTFLARNAGEDDVVCIYFAGHGSPEIDSTGKADDRLEKFIVPYDAKKDDLFSYGLSMETIRDIYERIKSKRVIFFIDSCYSGEAGGRTFSRSGIKARNISISEKFLEQLSGEGRIIITASKPDELSLEADEFKHGIFTYYLAEGLKGKADINKDGVVTIDELYRYVYNNVLQKTRLLGVQQHPLKIGTFIGEIPLTFCETQK